MTLIGETRHGEEVQISTRAAESDLIVYVNINLVSMDGGWKSTATGLSGLPGAPPPPQRRHHAGSRSRSWTRSRASCHRRNWRQGEVLSQGRRRGLPDRDHGQQRPVRRRPHVGARQARMGVERPGPGRLPRRHGRGSTGCHPRPAARSCTAGGPRTGSPRSRPARSRRSTGSPPPTCTSSNWCRSRVRPTSSHWACRTSARTTSTRS